MKKLLTLLILFALHQTPLVACQAFEIDINEPGNECVKELVEKLKEVVGVYCRADDLCEIGPRFIYELTYSKDIYLTVFSTDMKKNEEKKVWGKWSMEGEKLIWESVDSKKKTFEKKEDGRWYDLEDTYYVPVFLVPYKIVDGKPEPNKSTTEQGGVADP